MFFFVLRPSKRSSGSQCTNEPTPRVCFCVDQILRTGCQVSISLKIENNSQMKKKLDKKTKIKVKRKKNPLRGLDMFVFTFHPDAVSNLFQHHHDFQDSQIPTHTHKA